jgi:flagellar FliL protein
MAEKENAPEQAPAKKLSKKMLFIAAGVLVLLAGGGVTAFLLLGGEKPAPQAAPSETAGGGTLAATPSGRPEVIGPMVDIEPFIVNILDQDGTRYLKAAITLEMADAEAVEAVTRRMPQLRDAILLLIGNKSFNELSDLQGKLQLRSELLDRLNRILSNGSVRKIYFTDFVVQ